MTFDLDLDLDLEDTLDAGLQAHLGTIMCKFGRDRVMCVVVVAICAKKVYRRQTDGRTDRRTTDASRLHKLME